MTPMQKRDSLMSAELLAQKESLGVNVVQCKLQEGGIKGVIKVFV